MVAIRLLGCWLQAASIGAPADRTEDTRVRATVLAGVDTNAEQSRSGEGLAGAMNVDLSVDHVRRLNERTLGLATFDTDLDLFSDGADASQVGLGASLGLARFLVGNGSIRRVGGRRRMPRLRAEAHLVYGLALQIEGPSEAPSSVWQRAPEDPNNDELPELADDDVLDPDAGLNGPAVAFAQPLHDIALVTRLRWEPLRRTRLTLEPVVRRILQNGDPGDPRRHYVQTELGVSLRQRIFRWVQIEGEYRFERRDHDERRDRADDPLVLATHRTEAALRFRIKRFRLRLQHQFRFRSASGNGSRTRRHVARIDARWRFHRPLSLVATGAGAFQARLDRGDRDWVRWRGGLGLEVRY